MNDDTFQNISNSFYQDADFFESQILNLKVEELTVKEIVNLYYQVINLTSIIEFFKRQDCQYPQDLLKRTNDIEKVICNEFNCNIHPKILQHLSNLIMSHTESLKSQSTATTKDEIEKNADAYNKLRELMSTKEFVVQYERGLQNA